MKIIAVDNYDRESVSDILVCENVHEYYGKRIVEKFNTESSDRFLRLVPDSGKLYKFEP